jgi:lysophospholipase L1-like esterase
MSRPFLLFRSSLAAHTDGSNRSRARTLAYYAVGSLLTIGVLFGATELVTRTISWATGNGFTLALHELDAYDPGIERIYQFHPFTGFMFRPNSVVEGGAPGQQHKSVVRVDAYGFLSKDGRLSLHKGDDEIRIAVIGASTTANLQLSYEENWPGRLGALLERALPNKTIRVINAALPGFDTAQSVANLALRVMPFRPDVVIIYHAYNDLKAIRADRQFFPDYSHIHRLPYGYHDKPPFYVGLLNRSMFYVRMRNRYRAMAQVSALTDDSRSNVVPEAAEHAFEQHIRAMVAIARSGGAKAVLSSFATLHDPGLANTGNSSAPQLSRLQQREFYSLLHFTPGLTLSAIFNGISRYNAVLHKVATAEKTGWVDNAILVPHEDEYFVDRVHFSAKGAARMADNFLPVVLQQLQQKPTRVAAGEHD